MKKIQKEICRFLIFKLWISLDRHLRNHSRVVLLFYLRPKATSKAKINLKPIQSAKLVKMTLTKIKAAVWQKIETPLRQQMGVIGQLSVETNKQKFHSVQEFLSSSREAQRNSYRLMDEESTGRKIQVICQLWGKTCLDFWQGEKARW